MFSGGSIVVQFSEPVKDLMIDNPGAVTFDPEAVAELQLDPTQRVLTVRMIEAEPGTDYEMRIASWVVQDLNDNFIEDDFELNFKTAALPEVMAGGLENPRGAATHGAFAYLIDNVTDNEKLNVYRVGDSEARHQWARSGCPRSRVRSK